MALFIIYVNSDCDNDGNDEWEGSNDNYKDDDNAVVKARMMMVMKLMLMW